ncbi:MAG: type ISP restriction/modification enzyme, partial [Flammeovirgaceae bacterium]
MQHMLQDNLALITARSNKSDTMDHFFVSETLMEAKCGERTTQSNLFPLYLYKPTEPKRKGGLTMMLFEPEESYGNSGRKPNISKEVLEKLEKAYKKKLEASPL